LVRRLLRGRLRGRLGGGLPELLLLLRNNLIFVFAVPGILLISLVVTVLLFEEVPGWRFFRSAYYTHVHLGDWPETDWPEGQPVSIRACEGTSSDPDAYGCSEWAHGTA